MKEKRIYVCFTCSRDNDLLNIHYQTIRRIDPDSPIIYAYDKDDTIPSHRIGNAVYVMTGFARHGNLNGADAVRGEIMTMMQLLQQYDAQRVVKIDSDTLMVGDEWIEYGCDVGYHSYNAYGWTGCCYSLTRLTVGMMLDYVQHHNIGDERYIMPEDLTITMIAALVGGRVRIIEMDSGYMCIPFSHEWWHNTFTDNQLEQVQVIHCGQWQRLKQLSMLDRTTVVRRDMMRAYTMTERSK